MKKICFVLSLFILFACKEELKEARIEGEIRGLSSSDTIYLYGVEDLYDRVDTVYLKEGVFSIDLPIDTLTLLRMVVRDSLEYPLFIDKQEKLTIFGSLDDIFRFKVKSKNGLNEEYLYFQDSIVNNQSNFSDSLFQEKTKQYIIENKNSLISVYLLDTYFVNVRDPNIKVIKSIIDKLTGELKDRNSISTLIDKIEELEKVDVNKTTPFFTFNVSDGKVKTRTTFKDKYLVIQFWASWDKNSRKQNEELKEFYKKYKKEKNLDLVSISLDLDSIFWKKAIKEDSLVWDQVCDFKSWSSELVKQFSICEIPTLILINPQSKILDREIEVNHLTEQLDSLLVE